MTTKYPKKTALRLLPHASRRILSYPDPVVSAEPVDPARNDFDFRDFPQDTTDAEIDAWISEFHGQQPVQNADGKWVWPSELTDTTK